ncbi:Uncharacterised protein [Klebsiella pneumoniae]|nr:Uncharacterised protein [Klebsiella pneumoniae]SXH71230.1 Uncharacterised protein [Klebsiella pneumoniae]
MLKQQSKQGLMQYRYQTMGGGKLMECQRQ